MLFFPGLYIFRSAGPGIERRHPPPMSIAPAESNVDDATSNAPRCELWNVLKAGDKDPYRIQTRICVARTYPHEGRCQPSRRIARYAPFEIDVGGPIVVDHANLSTHPTSKDVHRAAEAIASAGAGRLELPTGDCGVACWAVFRLTRNGRVYELQNEQIAADLANRRLPSTAWIVFGYRSGDKSDASKYYGTNLPGGVAIVLRNPYVAVRDGEIRSAGYDELKIVPGTWTDAVGIPGQRTRCFIDPDASGGAGGGAAAAPQRGRRSV